MLSFGINRSRLALQTRQGLVSRTRNVWTTSQHKERLVILGSGWGGYGLLRGIDRSRYDVMVISPNSYFNFTPLLASSAVGTLEFRCVVEPVRRYTPQVTYWQAWCDNIDFQRKVLTCMPATPPPNASTAGDADGSSQHGDKPFTIGYDKLVVAVGAYSQTFNVPGVKEHAHFLKDVKDARKIRSRILECFEQANQPTLTDIERRNLLNFCIVGGGPTGVEFGAELHDLLHTDIARHYPRNLVRLARINLYDVAPNILGMFDQNLRKYTEKTLSREGINIHTSHNVERVESGKMIVKDLGEVPFGMLVWSTGLAPNPLVEAIEGVRKHPKTSNLVTDNHLNLIREDGTTNPDVWVIGDAGTVKDIPLPATAQVASQKAKYMAKKLNSLAKEKGHTTPFEFQNNGSLAYIGDWKAIYDRTDGNGNGDGVLSKETGRVAWLLWRSAYFTMTLSWRNKILVPFYWFLNWIFGRDLTRF
ncbi:nad(p)h dehydrogenase b1 [Coprinopsis sp. MPI-PUGE-AT-0042]|nr:nad(p)h dehydrogenase b1 [Coprinopsis sp. MPI-PUGE-AT-0042]